MNDVSCEVKSVEIKHVDSKEKFNEYYHFFSKVFYDDSVEHNEHYYPMYNAYSKLIEQYEKDPGLLLYIEDDGKMVATIAVKDFKGNEATIDTLAVDKNYRGKGYASILLKEIERKLVSKGVENVSLGARFRACNVYLKNGYDPTLLVQVNDFATSKLIKKCNKYGYAIVNEYQNEVCGAVFYKVDTVDYEVIEHFEKNVPTAHVSYIFTKKLQREMKK